MKQTSLRDARGFTLSEVLIAIVVAGVVVAALSTTLYYAALGTRGADTTLEATALVDQVYFALADRTRCGANLAGSPVSSTQPNGQDIVNPGQVTGSPAEIFLLAADGTRVPDPILKVGSPVGNGIVATAVRILPGVEVETGHRIGELDIEISRGAVLGPSRVVRRMAIDMTVANEKLVSCSVSAEADEQTQLARACDVSSDGSKLYNPATGVCEPVPTIWIAGNATSASCPSNTQLYTGGPFGNCKATPPPGYVDDGSISSRTYPDGSVEVAGASPFRARSIDSNTCVCQYAVGVNSGAGWTCMADCIDPNN